MSDWVDLAPLSLLETQGCATGSVEGVPVAVFCVGDRLFAIEDECSHEAYPLSDGDLEGDTIVCAQHGARFSLETGEALTAPAYEPVATYEARVADGRVQVRPLERPGRGDEP
jgi:3-phenylpropionate/trans-cinnamate dioxygenase ferredoxin subunit